MTSADWRNHLTGTEAERLEQIDRLRDELTAERRRIWDRCRKRMQKETEHG